MILAGGGFLGFLFIAVILGLIGLLIKLIIYLVNASNQVVTKPEVKLNNDENHETTTNQWFKKEKWNGITLKVQEQIKQISQKISKGSGSKFGMTNPKFFVILSFLWVLFHSFMLMTSQNVLYYRLDWNDFWIFNDWRSYYYIDSYSYKNNKHYDISEFIIYVILPLFIYFSVKYLRGEKAFNFKQNNSFESKLRQINQLKIDGLIDEEEYKALKNKIINKGFDL